MNAIVILTTTLILLMASPAAAQAQGERRGLSGVLDTLGGLIGAGGELHGTVVLARDTTLVLRTDDRRTLRIDTASLEGDTRRQLAPGRAATVKTRGGGDVLTATGVQMDRDSRGARTFSRVSGTVQERSDRRVMFRTREGLTLPLDTSQVRGLPSFAANEPATLIYEQGPRQEILMVWIEPGDAPAAAAAPANAPPTAPGSPTGSPPLSSDRTAAAPPDAQRLEGVVETVGLAELTLQTTEGRRVPVETHGVDQATVASVRPGDQVVVTGTPTPDNRFQAKTLNLTKAQ
jgi:hypothetical protein